MDYYQGVVVEWLRVKRSCFVNTECLIQLTEGNSPKKGEHWYCDAVAVDFKDATIYLCEVTYSKTMGALVKRLESWQQHWALLREALVRDCGVPADWKVQPWVFIPSDHDSTFQKGLSVSRGSDGMPTPHVTHLEKVTPWCHPWNGRDFEENEAAKAAERVAT
jgi:hypothetical protein